MAEVDSVETAKKLVERGIGFCFLPEKAVERELKDGGIIRVALAEKHDLNRRIELILNLDSTSDGPRSGPGNKIGRASCRERV